MSYAKLYMGSWEHNAIFAGGACVFVGGRRGPAFF